MKRNDIRIRKDAYSHSSINKFKDFDRLSRTYRRRQRENKAKRIAFMIIVGLVATLSIIYVLNH